MGATMKNRNFDEYVIKRFKKNPKEANYHLKISLKDYERTGELIYLLMAIKNVIKAQGVCKTAERLGITRQALWKTLRPEGNPKILTLEAILRLLGYTFSFKKIA